MELTIRGAVQPIREAKLIVVKSSSTFICPPRREIGDFDEDEWATGVKKRRAILGRISDQRDATKPEFDEFPAS